MRQANIRINARRVFLAAASSAALIVSTGALAQGAPIKIGMGIALTGPLGAGGKAALLGQQIWRDDINAKGGLLGRKVELIVYDDQSNPATVPGIYTKLIDVDKVDLLVAPYGTNQTAPIMPLVKQRGLLLMGKFSFEVNERVQHDMWFNNSPWRDSLAWSEGFLGMGVKAGGKTVAFLQTDGEFSLNLAAGAKNLAKHLGLKTVYDQTFPPNTADFSAIIRALKATKPDIVFAASYPGESIAIVRAANEIGLGPNVKIFGGGLVGLQFAAIMESLGSQINGIVNYNSFVPEKTMNYPGVADFLTRYQARAVAEKVDPLGYYLPPFNYAIGQMIEQAVTATKSLDQKTLAAYIRTNEMKTIIGPINFGPHGEWKTSRLIMVQYQGIKDKNMDQFKQPGRQVILYPENLKTGEFRFPYEKSRR